MQPEPNMKGQLLFLPTETLGVFNMQPEHTEHTNPTCRVIVIHTERTNPTCES
jgi:hypothetical protein